MNPSTGQLAFIFIAALLLSCVSAWAVAWRYRSAMKRLMSEPPPAAAARSAAPAAAADAPDAASVAVSLADNRRAALRLTLWLTALSGLIAGSGAFIWLWLAFPDDAFAPRRAAVLALMHAWPLVPVLGLLWRWSLWRLLGALALFCALCFAVMLWRSVVPQPLQLLLALAVEIGPALAMVALVFAGSATRAVAPWLLPLFVALVWASMLGIDALAALVERRPAVLMWLPSWLGAIEVMASFALLPWLLAWWPLRRLGRALAQAYVRKQLSELMVMFTAIWALALLVQAVSVASTVGVRGAAMLLPLLWIPVVTMLVARLRPAPNRVPTLLVLRVFQHDAQVQRLFDHVVERWRLSGNTVLIAGTDLADRTLDADDIFAFLDGRLATRFIRSPADVAPRLAAFDLAPDADGRFRVNECYCHDSTWQDALRALVERSDVVLMDLRGFQAHNAGCRHELEVLAHAARGLRVVVLVDAQTDRAAAAESVAGGAAARFTWIDAQHTDARRRAEVLAALFVPSSAQT
jgi:hypothetical protein